MMDMDGPLDFEDDDPLLYPPPPPVDKRRTGVIGLDDLLSDFYVENSKRINREYKRAKFSENYNSDEDDNGKEALLSKYVRNCQAQMMEIGSDEEIQGWGLNVFGSQKSRPPHVSPELQNCSLLKSFIGNEINSLVGLSVEGGERFLEGVLVNGWLAKLAVTCGIVEKSIAMWTFDKLLYSSKEELSTSAADFWSAILLPGNEVNKRPLKIGWLPTYAEVKIALETYGFLFDFPSTKETDHSNSGNSGPLQNIRAWVKFVTAACRFRERQIILPSSAAEELTEVILLLFLDPQLQGLFFALFECVESIIWCFEDMEWTKSCEKIAKSLAQRIPRDYNCLRVVECISGLDHRSKQLKGELAYRMLVAALDYKAVDEDIISSLLSINLKDKGCDLFKTYVNLTLAENWLRSSSVLRNKPALNEMWCLFLRNCSCQIASADLRSYAPKIRSKAAYLLQGCTSN